MSIDQRNKQKQPSGVEHIDKEWAATHSADLLKLLEQEHKRLTLVEDALRRLVNALVDKKALGLPVPTEDGDGYYHYQQTARNGEMQMIAASWSAAPNTVYDELFQALDEAEALLAGQPAERTEER